MTCKKKLLWWLGTITALITIIIVANYIANLKYKPVLNPNPKYFMTIHGNISPALIGKVRLKWIARYSSSDKRCDVTYNWIEGVTGWRYVDVPYIATPSPSGDYEIKIPFDYYKPGYCNWNISEIDDNSGTDTLDQEGGTLVQFYPCGTSFTCNIGDSSMPKSYQNTAQAQNLCHYNPQGTLACDISKFSTGFSDNSIIPRNEHYDFIENYKLSC